MADTDCQIRQTAVQSDQQESHPLVSVTQNINAGGVAHIVERSENRDLQQWSQRGTGT